MGIPISQRRKGTVLNHKAKLDLRVGRPMPLWSAGTSGIPLGSSWQPTILEFSSCPRFVFAPLPCSVFSHSLACPSLSRRSYSVYLCLLPVPGAIETRTWWPQAPPGNVLLALSGKAPGSQGSWGNRFPFSVTFLHPSSPIGLL